MVIIDWLTPEASSFRGKAGSSFSKENDKKR